VKEEVMDGVPHGGCNWRGCKECFPPPMSMHFQVRQTPDGSLEDKPFQLVMFRAGTNTIAAVGLTVADFDELQNAVKDASVTVMNYTGKTTEKFDRFGNIR
jgi:hypothetical protein